MLVSEEVKEFVRAEGADIVGIADALKISYHCIACALKCPVGASSN